MADICSMYNFQWWRQALADAMGVIKSVTKQHICPFVSLSPTYLHNEKTMRMWCKCIQESLKNSHKPLLWARSALSFMQSHSHPCTDISSITCHNHMTDIRQISQFDHIIYIIISFKRSVIVINHNMYLVPSGHQINSVTSTFQGFIVWKKIRYRLHHMWF